MTSTAAAMVFYLLNYKDDPLAFASAEATWARPACQ